MSNEETHGHFTSFGGGRHHTAIIGAPPESRDWKPGDDMLEPWIHPSARIEASVTVDAGITRPTTIADGTWLMKHVHVGHDAVINANCELAPGTVIGGHAMIGKNVKMGIGALVLPFKRIGDNARIGAGAVVTKDVPAGEVWAGNPAVSMHGVYLGLPIHRDCEFCNAKVRVERARHEAVLGTRPGIASDYA